MNDTPETRAKMLEILYDAFGHEFKFMTRDKHKLAAAYSHIFNADKFFTAEFAGRIAGILAVSDCMSRASSFDRKKVAEVLGKCRAFFAAADMSAELNATLNMPPDTSFIEYVAVAADMRGRGIASALIDYTINNLPYKQYILEVFKANEKAIRLYAKHGFKETGENPLLYWDAKHKIVMRYTKE